jgi:hypothetical protein
MFGVTPQFGVTLFYGTYCGIKRIIFKNIITFVIVILSASTSNMCDLIWNSPPRHGRHEHQADMHMMHKILHAESRMDPEQLPLENR